MQSDVNTTMAPPATKRRKIRHGEESDGSDESEIGFARPQAEEADLDDESVPGSETGDSDEALDGVGEVENVQLTNDEESAALESEAPARIAQRKAVTSKPVPAADSRKRPDVRPQDGVYTAETFKSNVFKLQVDELLEQVKPKYGKKEAPAENAMRTLKTLIEQLPIREPMSVVDAEEALRSTGVTIPFPTPHPPKDAKYKLQYERPSSINAAGSYPLKTATQEGGELAIDLVVTMPKAIFQEKDYLNHRYFYKRAYYLACLAAGVQASKEHSFKLSFDCLNGNQLQPIIVVRSSGDGRATDFSNSKCRIHILLALPEDIFPASKLFPKANCIRPRGSDDEAVGKPPAPTPYYNSTLQSDATITAYLKLLHATSGKCVAFRDACVLGRVWMGQRGLGSRLRKGGFGNFEWAVVMALLLQSNPGSGTPALSPGYSSYQLFKATLQFLAHHDLLKKAFTFQARDIAFPKAEASPIIFDGPRGLNILFKMTPWSYARLQLEAKLTIAMLGDSVYDRFDSTFILKADLLTHRYDGTLELSLPALCVDSASEDYEEQLNSTCLRIYKTLTRALTNRITAISFSMPDERSWSVSSPRPQEDQRKRILVNFATDPANAYRTVDLGPAAENKAEAAAFRAFWGTKAELRRFRDGSILESVVWSNKEISAPVLEQIVFYILGKHISPRLADEARFTSDRFAHLIPPDRIQGQYGVSAFMPIMSALSAVEKDIRGLEGLPLHVRHIRAADSQLRYSSVAPPPNAPASITLQFEGSGRWPDDLCAVQRTKIAFLLKLSELLSAQKPGYTARVGLEHPSQPSQNQAYLEITASSGFTFHLRIHHEREATLLDYQLKDKALDVQSRESAATALALYKRDFLQIPSHTQAIQTLCTRLLALSPAIRLTKQWFASHLLSPHFAPELIELLVVRTFLQPHPWPVPSCATTGFLRTLAWISRWDWRHVPLIVDLSSGAFVDSLEANSPRSNGMKPEDVEKIQTRFEAWRRIDPAMNRVVLFAATNLDTDGNTWTDRGKPEKVVAARMTSLAKAAASAVRAEEDRLLAIVNGENEASNLNALTPESLFASQLQDYDFVIHMAPKYSRAGKKNKSGLKFKNVELQQATGTSQEATQYLGELYVEDLQNVYGDAILWFWNPEAMDTMAGLWNPAATSQRGWKIKVGWNSLLVKSADKATAKENGDKRGRGVDIQLNKAAVCNEIRRLGGELVSRIDVNR